MPEAAAGVAAAAAVAAVAAGVAAAVAVAAAAAAAVAVAVAALVANDCLAPEPLRMSVPFPALPLRLLCIKGPVEGCREKDEEEEEVMGVVTRRFLP